MPAFSIADPFLLEIIDIEFIGENQAARLNHFR